MKQLLGGLGAVVLAWALSSAGAQEGQQLFQQNCVQCHGESGAGGVGPALAGNENLQSTEGVIQQILNGGGGMPAFGEQLSHEQIAAVASYIRTSWGNDFGAVDAEQVAQQQQQLSQQERWYSRDQADRGQEQYEEHCSVCHGSALEGRAPYPPLIGEPFIQEWGGRTLRELFDFVSTKMPQDRPGTLEEETYADIMAFVLQENLLPAGEEELDPDSDPLEDMVIPGGPEGQGEPQSEQQAEGQAQAGETTVQVSLVDGALEMPSSVPAGSVTFTVTNEGTVDHNFEIEGQGVEEEFESDLEPGETRTMTIELQPGTYRVYCPVGNHAEQGMELQFTVTEPEG